MMLPNVEDYSLDTPLTMKAAPNFRIYELIRSETAERNGIDNMFPDVETMHRCIFLSRAVMQPVRDRFGPYRPNSVFRGQPLERALKRKPDDWVSRGQHPKGEAGDMEIPGVSNLILAEWIAKNLEFDQLILECYDPAIGDNSGWVHVSRVMDGNNRGNVMSYVKINGSYQYINGLAG